MGNESPEIKPPELPEVAQQAPPRITSQPPSTLQMLAALREFSTTGKIDPISVLSYIMLIREIRRMEQEDNRPQQTQSSQIDIDKLIEKMNESWEKRFMEYQHRIEELLLRKKAEEAEKKAEELEKKIKEIEEEKRQEEYIQKRIEEALNPIQERLKEIQSSVITKLSALPENERKTAVQTLAEEIERTIAGEIGRTISGFLKDTITKAFTKEETPVTKEGKVDWIKFINTTLNRVLDTMKAIAEKMPARPPPLRPIQEIPIPPQITAPQPTPIQPPQPQEPTAQNVSRETLQGETIKREETPIITEEQRVERPEARGSAEATGEGSEGEGSKQTS